MPNTFPVTIVVQMPSAILVAWVERTEAGPEVDHYEAFRFDTESEYATALSDATARYFALITIPSTVTANVAHVIPGLNTDYF